MVARYAFTYDDPGPFDVNVESLTHLERNQLLYNVRRRVLQTDKPDRLVKLCRGEWAASKGYATPAEVPAANVVKVNEVDVENENRTKEYKDLLLKSANSIKKNVADKPVSEIRKILDLEVLGKNRKGVTKLLNLILSKHAEEVMSSVGELGDGEKTIVAGRTSIGSPLVSDIVDSDVQLIEVLNPLGDERKDG